ncbi:AraC family transcriptional regulator [Frigidibacter sp. MR17.14]|uniref:AraC family transcriptional regulator n=1 Tax=Frigidibacter sp. MR17.14 TaxID=3126509 RepID=UPI003012E627
MLADLARRAAGYAADHAIGEDPHALGAPGLSLMRAQMPGPMRHVVYEPLVCLILQGAKRIFLPGAEVTLRSGQALVASFDLPVTSRVVEAGPQAPYLGLALALDRALLRDLAARMPALPETSTELPVTAGPAEPALVAAFARLWALTEEPQALPVLAPHATEEIHYRLLAGPQGATLRRLARPEGQGERISRAVEAIRRAPGQTHAVGDLARIAGMSLTRFHESFRALTSVTPLQFQKQLRLTEARRLLGAGRHGVAQAAFEVGYESPTQFSREYARMFGHPPMRDLPRAQAAV